MTVIVSAKGQIVIPAEARRALGIKPGAQLSLAVENGALVLRPAKSVESADLLEAMHAILAAANPDGPLTASLLVSNLAVRLKLTRRQVLKMLADNEDDVREKFVITESKTRSRERVEPTVNVNGAWWLVVTPKAARNKK